MTIDELIVKLSLDPSNFTKGQKEAVASFKNTKEGAASAAKSMEDSGKKGSEFFGALQKGALGLFAVLVGGNLEKFIANTVTGMSALQRSAQIMGESTQDVQAFALAMERAGGSREAAIAQLQKISQLQQDFKYGKASGDYAQAANLAGIQATDSDLTLLEKYAAYAEKNRNDPKRVSQIGRALGLDDVTIAMAMKGAKNFRDEIQKSKEMGLISDSEIKKLQELNAAFKTLTQSIVLAGQHLVSDMAGPLTDLLKQINALITHANPSSDPKNPFLSPGNYWQWFRKPFDDIAAGRMPGDEGGRGASASRQRPSIGAGKVGMGQYVEDYFRRKGWKPNAAAGFAGTAYAESGLNPFASNMTGGGQGAHGMFQLRGEELNLFRRYYGHNPDQLAPGQTYQQLIDENLEFMHWRASGAYRKMGNRLQKASNTSEATGLVIDQYEAPGYAGAQADRIRADRYQALRRSGRDVAIEGTKSVTIGAINITVPNGDPTTIAKGVGGALRTHLAQQANGGPH